MSKYLPSFSLYQEGMTFAWAFQITKKDMEIFTELSKDSNPIHKNSEFAQEKGFREPIVYGVLMLSQLSRLVGMELPDQHTIITNIKSDFISPAYINEMLNFESTIQNISQGNHYITFKWKIMRKDVLICKGSLEGLWKKEIH